jgi:hypothetical protein
MTDELFVLTLAACFGALLGWAFKTLPEERWQILASVPVSKDGQDNWTGVNLTYYGVFIALATVIAVSVVFVLLAAISVPAKTTFIMVGLLFCLCFPAAKMIARVVENKPQTLTIGGASFLGFLASPGIVWALGTDSGLGGSHVPALPALASMVIAYALGEGLGRLACISFGCCYGKPLAQCHPWLRRVIGRHAFVFSGKVKKIAYERGLDGKGVVPIQAITSVLYVTVALAGVLLYLKSCYSAAFIVTLTVTQSWRAVSEFLRADYRGNGKLSAYQIMAMMAIAYGFLVLAVFSGESLPAANLKAGVVSLWDPAVLIFLQFIGLATFFFTGRSMVTASSMSFHVVRERI